jgi:MFS family permease
VAGVNYLSFVTATALSSVGDAAWYLALSLQIARTTGPATAGAVLALAGLPRLVMLLGGGALADRSGPKRSMIFADLARGVVMALAAVIVIFTEAHLVVLVGAAVLLAVLSAFFIPASAAMRPQLLPDTDLARGNALYSMGLRGGQALGGPIGAWLLGLGGIAMVAAANAVSFAVSALALAFVRTGRVPEPKAADPEPLWRGIRHGIRYVLREHRIARLLAVGLLVELSCAGPLNIGLALISDRSGWGTGGAGLLLTAFAIGSAASLVVVLVFPPAARAGTVLLVGIAGQGTSLALLGLSAPLGWGLAAYAGVGLMSGIISTIAMSLLQQWSDGPVRGRVLSVNALLVYSAVPIGNLVIGVLIQFAGLPATIAIHVGLSLLALAIGLLTRDVRGARLPG